MKRNGYDCFQLNRRDFIGAIAGTAAWTGCTSLLAAERLGRPNLIVGVLSDIHLSNEEVRKSKSWTRIFVETLKFYKKRGVDAVIIAGDLTNGGRMSEMRVVADAWKSVFGDSDTPVKVFVTGNHEFVYYDKKKKEGDLTSPVVTDGLYADIRRNWKELFNEEWSPYFIKTVKGYSFVGAHWGDHLNGKALKAFIDSNRNTLSGSRPFFFVQHAHPKDTCYGSWTWDQRNGGDASKILSAFPNAVAFSGHTHYSLTDERSVWQGSFTSIGTAALRTVYLPYGRENSGTKIRMPWMRGGAQGMLMTVWDDEFVLERYSLSRMEKVGEDWVVPVLRSACDPRPFAFAERSKLACAPEFAEGSKIVLSETKGKDLAGKEEDQLVVSFPAARGRGDSLSRVYDYEVALESVSNPDRKCVKLVYQPGILNNVKHMSDTASCVFGKCELPPSPYNVRVTPRNSYEMTGKPIFLNGQN